MKIEMHLPAQKVRDVLELHARNLLGTAVGNMTVAVDVTVYGTAKITFDDEPPKVMGNDSPEVAPVRRITNG